MVSKFGLSFTSGIPWISSQWSQPCRWFLQWFPPCRRPSRQPGVFENRYHCNQLETVAMCECPAFSRTVFGRPFLRLRQMDRVKAKPTANMDRVRCKTSSRKVQFHN